MEIKSEVPAKDTDYVINAPFFVEIGGQRCEFTPLALPDYLKLDKIIFSSLLYIEYHTTIKEGKSNERLISSNKILRFVCKKMIKPGFLKMIWILLKHNLTNVLHFDKLAFSKTRWIQLNTFAHEMLELLSYYTRYICEIKKKSRLILQKGIDTITQETVETSEPSNGLGKMLDFMSPSGNTNGMQRT